MVGTNSQTRPAPSGPCSPTCLPWVRGKGPRRPARRPFTEMLAARGVQPVSYVDWLRVEAAEAELASALGRGERVKIGDREAIEALSLPAAD